MGHCDVMSSVTGRPDSMKALVEFWKSTLSVDLGSTLGLPPEALQHAVLHLLRLHGPCTPCTAHKH